MLFSPLEETRTRMKTIAIIGGGPAGATAAEKLARGSFSGRAFNGELRVNVFEERLGWEKPCGGGLSFKALERYPYLLDGSAEVRPIRDAEFVASNGSSVRFRLRKPLAVCSRSVLNQSLLRRAEEAGADIIQDRIVHFEPSRDGWRLKGRRTIYQADYLILAAGARCRLRQLLADDFRPEDFMLTYGYQVPARDDVLRIQFFDEFEGYAWAFPRSDHLSVGICAKVGKERMAVLQERLHRFMEHYGYSKDGAQVFSHLLPSLTVESWSHLHLAGKDWALAGDAAGLVDPLTGEGIYYAMRSGELLAESLLSGSLAFYPIRAMGEFGRGLVLGARLAPFFYRGDFGGGAVTTRMIQFARRSRIFMELLQDLIEGSQGYTGLAARLYRQLAATLADMVGGCVREGITRLIEVRGQESEISSL